MKGHYMKIKLPVIDQSEMIEDCIEGIQDSKRKTTLRNSKAAIVDYSAHYLEVAKNGKLSGEPKQVSIPGGATKDDMVYLYDERLVKSAKGRPYYEKIKANAPWGKCPICGYYVADTLDHYLPKSIYYRYAVSIANLVPSCIVCNKNKTSRTAEGRAEETIHPYFDDFDDEVWLNARIERDAGNPFGFVFEVIKPEKWAEEKYKRAKNHLEAYKLSDLYRKLSACEITKEITNLIKLYGITASMNLLKSSVQISLETEMEQGKNTWKSAMLRALSESEWFWNEFMPNILNEDRDARKI